MGNFRRTRNVCLRACSERAAGDLVDDRGVAAYALDVGDAASSQVGTEARSLWILA
jgi:hypothetical protein